MAWHFNMNMRRKYASHVSLRNKSIADIFSEQNISARASALDRRTDAFSLVANLH